MSKQDTPLEKAAAAFDAELATYMRLGDLFVKTPLSSVKHLERANATLADIAACEERLQTAGQNLVLALGTSRKAQEDLAKLVVAHVPVVQDRNKTLQELMNELAGVADEVGGLNAKIAARSSNGDSDAQTASVEAAELSALILDLSMRAEKLAERAREAQLEELATQAHALHQKLQAVGKKLAIAGGKA